MMSTWKANLSAVKIPFTLIVYQHIDANFLRQVTFGYVLQYGLYTVYLVQVSLHMHAPAL